MNLPEEKELKEFDKWKVARPTHEEHGVTDTWETPLSDQLKSGNPRNWHLNGNMLHCDTDFGPMKQVILSDYICHGTDEKGLPILKPVVL
jgi:hypothetical protein